MWIPKSPLGWSVPARRAGHWLWLSLVLVALALSARAPVLAEPMINGPAPNSTARAPAPAPVLRSICSNMDIRNRPRELEKLRGCVVVEGNLSVVLMDNRQPGDFAPYSFPDLREVTGYVLFAKVSGLQSLGQLFPNLTLVRGTQLVGSNYSLVVFQMPDLVELGLSSLELVQRGAVRVDSNPMLCHADTLDWDALAPNAATKSYVAANRPARECERCRCPSGQCWGPGRCRVPRPGAPKAPSGEDCNRNCVIGCNGTSALDCVACAGAQEGLECVDSCHPGRLLFQRRRCVSVDWCADHHSGGVDGVEHKGECIMECPEGTTREVLEKKDRGKKKYKEAADKEAKVKEKKKEICKPCVGPCRTECPGAAIRSPRDALQLLKGCTVIKGTLEIEIPHGGEEVEKALEPALGNIEVITGSLVVSRSRPLSSLRFLRSLREVRGLDSNKGLTVFINDNDNLQSLFDWDERSRSRTLSIAPHAQVTFYYNPRLCPQEIDKFARWTNLTKGQMINNFNGFNNPCGAWDLSVGVGPRGPESVVLRWRISVPGPDVTAGEVLAYAVYVTRAVRRNVTEYAGSIFCRYQPSDGDLDDGSPFGWMVVDVRFTRGEPEVSTLVPRLQPATLYAYYIKTYTVTANVNSQIRYFRTRPARPSPPSAVRAAAVRPMAGSLLVEWRPPARAQGAVSHYIVTGELRDQDDRRQLAARDYCEHPATAPSPAEALTWDEARRRLRGEGSAAGWSSSSRCCCSDCCRIPLDEEQCERLFKGAEDVLDACGLRVDNRSLDRCEHVLYNVVSENMNRAAESFFPSGPKFPGSSRDQGRSGVNLSEEWDHESRKRRFVRIEGSAATGTLVEALVPYGLYAISVHACASPGRDEGDADDDRDDVVAGPLDGSELTMSCSAASVTAARSLPAADADVVAAANATLQGESLLVSWAEPARPNGELVSYQVRYRDRHKYEANEQCVTPQSHRRHGGRVPIPLRSAVTQDDQGPSAAKRFVVEVRATSLAGPGRWVQVQVLAGGEGKGSAAVPAADDTGGGPDEKSTTAPPARGGGGGGSSGGEEDASPVHGDADATAGPGRSSRSAAQTVVALLLLLLGLLAVALFYLRRRAARHRLGLRDDMDRRRLVSSDLTDCWDLPDEPDRERDHGWPPNVHFDPDQNRVSFEPLPADLGVPGSGTGRAWQRWSGCAPQVYPELPARDQDHDGDESTRPSAPPLQQQQRPAPAQCTQWHLSNPFHPEYRAAEEPEMSTRTGGAAEAPHSQTEAQISNSFASIDDGVAPYEREALLFEPVPPKARERGESSGQTEDVGGASTLSLLLDRDVTLSGFADGEVNRIADQVNEGMHKSPSTDSFTSINLSDSEQDSSKLLRCQSRDKLD
ncbi:Insulin-like receptor [Frankliniella fusca]|uniref:receptor protein-tyrosine kinase n=1 Tax=Frankliniella fusca TaxID=407009 RepID=A0AAE1GUY5_9NEOP|nr:Insulin-like receptor [Frankliniella fusca]